MWDIFYKKGIAAIDWHDFKCGDLTAYTKEEIQSFDLGRNSTKCLYDFSHEVKEGDYRW